MSQSQQGCVLILAAGSGNRFGSDKRKARTASGSQLLTATLRCYQSLGWPVYVVIRRNELDLQQSVAQELATTVSETNLHWVTAADAQLGMGHSLRAGVTKILADGHTSALVGLADMPYLKPRTLERLGDALLAGQQPNQIVRPRHKGQPGNPVGFSGAMLLALETSSGDSGARPLLAQQREHIAWLDVDDAGVLQDIDRPADLKPA